MTGMSFLRRFDAHSSSSSLIFSEDSGAHQLEDAKHLFASNRRKVIEEFAHTISSLKIVEQMRYGNSCTGEARRSAHFFEIHFNEVPDVHDPSHADLRRCQSYQTIARRAVPESVGQV